MRRKCFAHPHHQCMGQILLDEAHTLDKVDSVSSMGVDSGRNGKDIWVEDNIFGAEIGPCRQEDDSTLTNLYTAFVGVRLPGFAPKLSQRLQVVTSWARRACSTKMPSPPVSGGHRPPSFSKTLEFSLLDCTTTSDEPTTQVTATMSVRQNGDLRTERVLPSPPYHRPHYRCIFEPLFRTHEDTDRQGGIQNHRSG